MLNTFILEGMVENIHYDSIDLRIDDNFIVNVKASPFMIELLKETSTPIPFISIQGRFIKENNEFKLLMEKLSIPALAKEIQKIKKQKTYTR